MTRPQQPPRFLLCGTTRPARIQVHPGEETIAYYESPRAMKLYDERQDEISLDEVQRIVL